MYNILAYMTKTVTASDARNDFFNLLKQIGTPGVTVTITYEGYPAGVLMSAEDFEGWQETMEILSDPSQAIEILQRLKNKESEPTVTFDQFKKALDLQ